MTLRFAFLFFDLAVFAVILAPRSAHALQITEVMYNPVGADTNHEWVELYNESSETVDLGAAKFFDGTNHTITRGVLLPGELAIVTNNEATFKSLYPDVAVKTFTSPMRLGNTGELIRITAGKRELSSLFFSPLMGGNGDGTSLEWRDNQWQSSPLIGGTPGVRDYSIDSPVVEFSEITPAPALSSDESVVLQISTPGRAVIELIDGGAHRSRPPLKAGVSRITHRDLGLSLNNDGEMIRVVNHRGRELTASPIFVVQNPGERLLYQNGEWRVVR